MDKMEKHEKLFQHGCPKCGTVNVTRNILRKEKPDACLVFSCRNCSYEYTAYRYFRNLDGQIGKEAIVQKAVKKDGTGDYLAIHLYTENYLVRNKKTKELKELSESKFNKHFNILRTS